MNVVLSVKKPLRKNATAEAVYLYLVELDEWCDEYSYLIEDESSQAICHAVLRKINVLCKHGQLAGRRS